MKTKVIKINTKQKKYNIYIGNNFISSFDKILNSENLKINKVLIVVDINLFKNHKYIIKKVSKGKETHLFKFRPSEKNKNIFHVNKIIDILLKNNFSREDCLISLGGGITGDLSGFTSSIYKRGIKFINIPTTLLAQVDASIGGKTGVNHSLYGKNLIGTFWQPDLVLSDTLFLKTLKRKELLCGYAEILKHSLIYDKNNFNFLDKHWKKIINLKEPYLSNSIHKSCNIKKKIVEKDENEKNIRKLLNLGHTFGHAYEGASQFRNQINHGEGVILGIKSSLLFSLEKMYISSKEYQKVLLHINKLNINLQLRNFFKKKDISILTNLMLNDKKNTSSKINLILLKNIGRPIINRSYNVSELKKFFQKNLLKI